LFNSRQNKERHSKYFCPKCLLKKKKRGLMTNVPAPPSAAELPRTKLSEQLETHVRAKVEEKVKQLAMEKARTEVRYFGGRLLLLYAFAPSFNSFPFCYRTFLCRRRRSCLTWVGR
jgi:hypothetical protein